MSGMRMGVLVVVMLVVASIGPSEARYIPVEAAVHSLAGQLLVATPELDDPNFSHTIVYMVQHDADGAMGLVINRVIGAGPLGKLLEGLGFEEGTDNEAEIQVHYGGPVDRGRPLVLHSSDYRRDGTLVIDDMAAFSVNMDVLRDIAHGEGPRRSMVALGYAGWGASQLEREIAQGSWFIIKPDEALLFDGDSESKWERALALRGVDL